MPLVPTVNTHDWQDVADAVIADERERERVLHGRGPIAPEDCPEPFWHETHRYCPVCTWTEPPIAPEPIVDCACTTHIDHTAMCDDECECWGEVSIAYRTRRGRRCADVITRIWIDEVGDDG